MHAQEEEHSATIREDEQRTAAQQAERKYRECMELSRHAVLRGDSEKSSRLDVDRKYTALTASLQTEREQSAREQQAREAVEAAASKAAQAQVAARSEAADEREARLRAERSVADLTEQLRRVAEEHTAELRERDRELEQLRGQLEVVSRGRQEAESRARARHAELVQVPP